MNITDYNELINCTDKYENSDINIIIKYLLLSIPANILLFFLKELVIYTMIKPLITNKR